MPAAQRWAYVQTLCVYCCAGNQGVMVAMLTVSNPEAAAALQAGAGLSKMPSMLRHAPVGLLIPMWTPGADCYWGRGQCHSHMWHRF